MAKKVEQQHREKEEEAKAEEEQQATGAFTDILGKFLGKAEVEKEEGEEVKEGGNGENEVEKEEAKRE